MYTRLLRTWGGRFPVLRVPIRTIIDHPSSSFPLQDDLLLFDWEAMKPYDDVLALQPAHVVDRCYHRDLGIAGPQRRILGNFAIALNRKVLWVPAIIDTGAANCYLGQRSLRAFFSGPIDIVAQVHITIGSWSGTAFLSPAQSSGGLDLTDVNIIGMDLLGESLIPVINGHLQTIFTARMPAVDPAWLTLSPRGLSSALISIFDGPTTIDTELFTLAFRLVSGSTFASLPTEKIISILEKQIVGMEKEATLVGDLDKLRALARVNADALAASIDVGRALPPPSA